MFTNANPSNLRGSSLKETRITCSIRRDQTCRSKSFMSGPSTSASVNYNDKRKSKDWRYKTHNTDLLSPGENKLDYKEELSMKEKVLRNTQIRKMHEMGEMKRAQELRFEQQMQEQMNYVHGLVRFSRCGINFLWKIVSRFQSACDDSEFSCFAQPRWNRSGLQEIVFGNQFSTCDPPSDYYQRIQSDDVQKETEERLHGAERTKTSHTSEDRQNQGTIPMLTFAPRAVDYEFYNTGGITRRTTWSDSKRQQMSELQFDKFPNPSSFLVWKNKIQNTSHNLFRFSIGCFVVDQRSGDGWFFGRG